ncbi:hypothetical protein [Planctomyces sp. SH-PL14]|uniref:hypothetical protein n=1 Tax=Planctomyces sp. SH-PL14 TaxID=1632864 RepID=UPI00078C40DE|nr:hypothetical protein [Planctomyces sp. SH-PL14]AMV19225.1 hypothetical protein VT03_15145 [Planctomyces sp. SH-PL14]
MRHGADDPATASERGNSMQAGRKVARWAAWSAVLIIVYIGGFVVIAVLYQKGYVPEGLSVPFKFVYAPLRWLMQNFRLANDIVGWLYAHLGGK